MKTTVRLVWDDVVAAKDIRIVAGRIEVAVEVTAEVGSTATAVCAGQCNLDVRRAR